MSTKKTEAYKLGLSSSTVPRKTSNDPDGSHKRSTWTRERPTRPGWYWWRREGSVQVVFVRDWDGHELVAEIVGCSFPIFFTKKGSTWYGKGEWYGPLEVPE